MVRINLFEVSKNKESWIRRAYISIRRNDNSESREDVAGLDTCKSSPSLQLITQGSSELKALVWITHDTAQGERVGTRTINISRSHIWQRHVLSSISTDEWLILAHTSSFLPSQTGPNLLGYTISPAIESWFTHIYPICPYSMFRVN